MSPDSGLTTFANVNANANSNLYSQYRKELKSKCLYSDNYSSVNTTLITPTNFSYTFQNNNKYDMIKIKNIKKEQNNLKLELQLLKKTKKHKFDFIHKEFLKESFNNKFKNELFLTNEENKSKLHNYDYRAGDEINKTNEDLAAHEDHEEESNGKDIILPKFSTTESIKFTSNSNNYCYYKTRDDVWSKWYTPNESLSNFVNKTKEIRLGNIIVEMKKERRQRSMENYSNKIDKVNDDMLNMKSSELLIKNYDEKFSKFTRFLHVQYEVEKHRLDELIKIKGKINLDIKKLHNQISVKNFFLQKYKEYRNFLLNVKDKRKALPGYFFTLMDEDQMQVLEKLTQNAVSTKIGLAFSKVNQSMKLTRRYGGKFSNNQFEIPISEKKSIDKLVEYAKLYKPIFKSIDEFKTQYDDLSRENINLLLVLNTLKEKYYKIEELNNIYKLETEDNNKDITEELKSKEEILNTLKLRNEKLKEIKEKHEKLSHCKLSVISISLPMPTLISESPNKKSSVKRKTSLNKNIEINIEFPLSYIKSREIVENLKDLLESNININDYNNYTQGAINNNKLLLILREIEIGMNILLEAYKNFKENTEIDGNANNIFQIEQILEKERKTKKVISNNNLKKINKEKIREEVYEKMNKILILPKRKTYSRMKPIKKIRKTLKDELKQDSVEFEELILYDDHVI